MSDKSTVETFESTDVESAYKGDRVVAWEGGAPVRQSDVDGRDKSTVDQPGVELLGAPSPAPARVYTDEDAQAHTDLAEVPETAAEVVAWIRAGEDESEEEATRRAGLAWSVETNRDGGVRSTVEAEVDKWLTPVG